MVRNETWNECETSVGIRNLFGCRNKIMYTKSVVMLLCFSNILNLSGGVLYVLRKL